MTKPKVDERPDQRSQRVMDRLETEVLKLERAVETLRDALSKIQNGGNDDDRR